MAVHNIQEPTAVEGPGYGNDRNTRYTHPAFAASGPQALRSLTAPDKDA